MRKDIFILIFNDKISYRIKNKYQIIDASKYISGTIIFNIDLFKNEIERIILSNQSIINFIKPNIHFLLPYNKMINNYLKYVISPTLFNKISISNYRLLLCNYMKNKIIINNKYTSDIITKNNLEIIRKKNIVNNIELINHQQVTYYINDIENLIIKSLKEITI